MVCTWANAGTAGVSWHQTLDEDSVLKSVLDNGEQLLQSRGVEPYKATPDEIETLTTEIWKMYINFFVKPPTELKTKASDCCTSLRLSYIEALLVTLYRSKTNVDVYKTKTHGIKKLCVAPVKWAAVFAPLHTRAAMAAKLQIPNA